MRLPTSGASLETGGRLLADRRGTATIEFALLSVFFFISLSAALDIGLWYQQRLRLDSAVEQGAMLAFGSRTNVDQAAVATYIAAAAKLTPPPTVTVGCNGGTSNCVNSSRTCACVTGSAPNLTFTPTTCNNSCADGSLAGYYMTIDTSAVSNTVVVSSAILGGITQKRSAIVRLQ